MKNLALFALVAAALGAAQPASAGAIPCSLVNTKEADGPFLQANRIDPQNYPGDGAKLCAARTVIKEAKAIKKAKGSAKTGLLKKFDMSKVPLDVDSYLLPEESTLLNDVYIEVMSAGWPPTSSLA